MHGHGYRNIRGEYEPVRFRAAAPPGQRRAPVPGGGQGKAATRPRSFLIGTQTVYEGGDYDQTSTATTGQSLLPWTLQATGWLAELIFFVTGTFTSAA